MPSPLHVVLLRDEGCPASPDTCCWRQSLRAVLAAAGARVDDAAWAGDGRWDSVAPPVGPDTGGRGRPVAAGRARRLAWLPAVARRPLAAAYRAGGTATGRLVRLPGRLATARRRRAELVPRLAGADLVIAETPAAARVAAGYGVPRARLWLLARPSERLFPGEVSGYGAELAAVVPSVGGFLAGSEADRDSVERAASAHRVRVVLFPPRAADRPCPSCHRTGAAQPVGAAPAVSSSAQIGAVRTVLGAITSRQPSLPRPRRSALVAGYDLKFAAELAEQLDRRTDLAVTVDDWPELGTPTRRTAARLRAADAVFAEWARTSAVWLSRRKRPGQFLAVRLHRFELDYPYPHQIAIDNVDAAVYIAPLFGRRIRDELGWPAEKLVYIPNYLDVDRLDRPKLPDARFALGIVGIEWSRKRFDLALELLAAVRREDPRFRLVVRSVMPWQNRYVWAQPAQREYAARCFARIEQDPLLRHAVFFDPPGQDMARWYRRIGHLVSTSDAEGSHASVAEAMAAGTVPVLRAWPGADEVYDRGWVHGSRREAVAAVLAGADPDRWAQRAAQARAEVRRTHDPAAVVAAWADLLHGDLAAARRHFPPQPEPEPEPELEPEPEPELEPEPESESGPEPTVAPELAPEPAPLLPAARGGPAGDRGTKQAIAS